ncbi:whey acidic protein-like [Gadus macrocephalus]|uniref:whey acidic protein-like n=1 Tax=Gadus macrocephalus TaxID=80720 RepID=UPI0028CBBB70|nr:whey acidic protein-like [Gadus macrocephalus]
MKMNFSVLSVLTLVLICAFYSEMTVDARPGQKKGLCPPRQGFGLCAEFCSGDYNCPNDQRCCSNGCGHQCTDPYIGKPGVCPPRHGGVGVCAEYCSEDTDCPHQEKCCSNGCGHQCTAPPYTGRIPTPPPPHTHTHTHIYTRTDTYKHARTHTHL